MIPQKSNLSIEILFELFYNLAIGITKKRRLTALTDFLTNYKIVSERLFLPLIQKGLKPMKKTEYINEINNLLNLADEELLDFIFQLLQQSVNPLLTEKHPQLA